MQWLGPKSAAGLEEVDSHLSRIAIKEGRENRGRGLHVVSKKGKQRVYPI